jgi:hypothetical protein
MYLVLALAFEEYNKNKHAAFWPPAPALSNKTLKGPFTCILPGGAPTHRRWHFNFNIIILCFSFILKANVQSGSNRNHRTLYFALCALTPSWCLINKHKQHKSSKLPSKKNIRTAMF